MSRPDHDPLEDAALDTLFDAAKADRAQPDARLMEAVLLDAEQVQHVALHGPVVEPKGLFAWLSELVGGWPALGGLATATLMGVYIGFASPDLLTPATEQPALNEDELLFGLWPGDELFFEEG